MRAEQWVEDMPWRSWDGSMDFTGLTSHNRPEMLEALSEGAWAWFDEAQRSADVEAALVELFGEREW